jgi:uncharacterized iron-regulated membrane protein
MSHTAPPSPSRRRIELAVGAVALVLGVLALVLTFVALSHPKGRQAARIASTSPTTSTAGTSASTSSTSPSTAAPTTSAAKPRTSAPTRTPAPTQNPNANRPAVVVLNNSGIAGLAAKAVSRLTQAGWRATDGGNFDGPIISTAVYYDPSVNNSHADADALQAQFPAIQRVKQKFGGLPGGTLILIVTSDYS